MSSICFLSGVAQDSTSEGNHPEPSNPALAKMQVFEQDCADAHEEFIKNQHTDTGTIDERRECDQSSTDMNNQVTEENGAPPLQQRAQNLDNDAAATEIEITTDNKQLRELRFKRKEVELVQAEVSEHQPPLIQPVGPGEDDVVTIHGPGPLVTELKDMEEMETIDLPLHRSLLIDDLPDLEDVDTEQFSAAEFNQQVCRPLIEVISGDSSEQGEV